MRKTALVESGLYTASGLLLHDYASCKHDILVICDLALRGSMRRQRVCGHLYR